MLDQVSRLRFHFIDKRDSREIRIDQKKIIQKVRIAPQAAETSQDLPELLFGSFVFNRFL